ncbi:MAG: helix-turn-helix transcriptional regulator [Pseudolysinimonas sp.]
MTTRDAVLHRVLDAVVADDLPGAIAVAGRAFEQDGDGWHRALGAFALFLSADYAGAAALGDEALAFAGDAESLQLARAARGIAGAGHSADGPDHLAAARADAMPHHAFTRYLLAEACLASARLDLAAEFVDLSPLTPLGHPYDAMMTVMRVRLLVFRGRITEAADLLTTIPRPEPMLMQLLVSATETLVRGNAAERSEVRALADRLEATVPHPRNYLTAGVYLLVAFGLVAVGDVSRSARLALLAGGDVTLARLVTADRGLSFELLVAAAALEGDVDAADAWCAQAEPLLANPISNSTIERVHSRVELLHGHAAAAVEWADRAVASARAQGRVVEVAEGEIVAARARIADSQAGDASSRLATMVEGADASGYVAARRAAARERRAAGRRLRPAPGSEWAGLSERERDVALMVAEGLGNREIAAELHLSEHTVRAHVSRVLAAFGAASRFVVAARVAELFPDPESGSAAPLTPRQQAVAERIARGAGNAEIGGELGLSVKTVEKHVGEIFRRWGVGSRVGVARRYRSLRQAPS